MSKQRKEYPEPGENPKFDAVQAAVQRVALDDPEALKGCLIGMLRFLRDVAGMPGVQISFDQLIEYTKMPQQSQAVCFAINQEGEYVIMMLLDGVMRA